MPGNPPEPFFDAFDLDRPSLSRTTEAKVAGQLVYAVGDIHGRYDLLKDLLARLWEDQATRGEGRKPILILCGDYIDRGPDSAKVIEALGWLQRQGEFELHLLKGNHEQAMLAFLDDAEEGSGWLRVGGMETLASYGVKPLTAAEGVAGYERLRTELLEHMPAAHLRLLQGLQLMVTIGDYAFVHAGVRAGIPLARQEEEDLLWIREGFVDSTAPLEKVVVHGHSWQDDSPQIGKYRLGIDTGAYQTGVLTALRVEDGEFGFIQAIGGTGAGDVLRHNSGARA
jgi:serine/threonine protein phosphatase 1